MLSVRAVHKESDFSAFDQSEVTYSVANGAINKNIVTKPRIQKAVYTLLNMLQVGPPSMYLKKPVNKYFKRQWTLLVFEALAEEPLSFNDGVVLHMTY